jgi:hypothetical protein
VAFRLGLIAEEEGPTVARARHPLETLREAVVAVLVARDLDVIDEIVGQKDERLFGGGHGQVEARGEETGLEAGGAEKRLLGEGDALDGEKFLGVDGLVDRDEVGLEIGDFVEFLDADNLEHGGGEAVFTCVLCGAGLAFRGARAGGACGIGPIGGALLVGYRFLGTAH